MDDETAYMELVRSNAQGEPTALEYGIHALPRIEKGKHGRGLSAYAKAVGRPEERVRLEANAARVANSCTCTNLADLIPFSRHLVETHAAAEWLWPALVEKLVSSDGRSVEAVRRFVADLEDLPAPPERSDAALIAAMVPTRAQFTHSRVIFTSQLARGCELEQAQGGGHGPLARRDERDRMGHKTPMGMKDDADRPPREPKWLTRLSEVAARSPTSRRKHRDAKWGSSSGAANTGRHLLSWSCTCGWAGVAQDLKPGAAGGISCPACGGAQGLTSTQARNV